MLPEDYNIFGWLIIILGPVIGMLFIYVMHAFPKKQIKNKLNDIKYEISNYGAVNKEK